MASRSHSPPGARLHYLDNIRSLVIVFVVLFHAVLPYGQCPWWYVVDSQTIPLAIFLIIFFEPILMPVLFFISGLLVWPSYKRKGPARFMVDKAKRLMAPFLLCTLLFSPIMPFIRQWLRAADSGTDPLGFWAFWLTFLKSGTELHSGLPNLATDLVVNQYWFLMLLFVFYSGFCLFNLVRGGRAGNAPDRSQANALSKKTLLLMIGGFGLVVGLIYALSCAVLDGNVWVTLGSLVQLQPSKVPIYLGFFLAGIYVERHDLLPRLLGLGRPTAWLAAAALTTIAYFTAVLLTFPVEEPLPALVLAARFLRLFLVLTVTLWALTFFHRRLNRSTPLWRELSENSYNIYLIHMVPQVVLQMLLLSCPVPAVLKFAVAFLITLLLSYLVSRFLVRKSTPATVLGLVLLFIVMCLVFR